MKYFQVKTNRVQCLIIFVTNKCNARCEHCFYWKELRKPIKEMTIEEYKTLVEMLPKLSVISLTGGEPFLRKDLLQIIEAMSKKAEIFISTNGILTRRIVSIVSKHPVHLNISLDGLKKTHNSIRGINCFDNVVETIKKAKPFAKSIVVNTVVTSRNYQELEKINRFVKNLGVEHNFSLVRSNPYSNIRAKPKCLELPNDLDYVHKTISKIYKNNFKENRFFLNLKLEQLAYTINMLKEREQRLVGCLAGKHTGVIYPDGSVAICEFFKPFASLRDFNFNFRQLWNSNLANEERKKAKNCSCYHDCFLIPSLLYDMRKFIKFKVF